MYHSVFIQSFHIFRKRAKFYFVRQHKNIMLSMYAHLREVRSFGAPAVWFPIVDELWLKVVCLIYHFVTNFSHLQQNYSRHALRRLQDKGLKSLILRVEVLSPSGYGISACPWQGSCRVVCRGCEIVSLFRIRGLFQASKSLLMFFFVKCCYVSRLYVII